MLYTLHKYHHAQSKRNNVHVFCSLFYKELQLSGSSGVAKFLQGIDIFEKEYLIFPINEHLHWFLLILCHPRRVLGLEFGNDRSIEISSEEEREPEDDELGAIREIPEPLSKCQIYQLDSLGCRIRSSAIESIKKFLIHEALRTKSVVAATKSVTHSALRVPLQHNCTDCGLFSLEFFEMFSKDPLEFEILAAKNALRDWFPPIQASSRRALIRKNIESLQDQYSSLHPVNSEACPETASSDVELIWEIPRKQ